MTHIAVSAAREQGIIAVLRAPSVDSCLLAADALVRGGVRALEITYSTPEPAAVIRELSQRYGSDVLLGAGTLTRVGQAAEVVAAGAAFLVAPGTRPAIAEDMKATGAAVMLGALTPTELMLAVELGADVVKVFPSSLGGPSYLRALRGPFPEVPLMPTGGVDERNLPDWFAAGAIAIGAGGELTPATALAAGDWRVVEQNARRFRSALDRVRAGAA
ncbi:MAG: 2-dehydro-3-deoxyphosphogluconate aldolase [Micrococcales bacterium 73-13]|nr:MAG: 2-dehydro-3-deoxyphosphogluconate aldolase [Micrococcales bacterium 73-13]